MKRNHTNQEVGPVQFLVSRVFEEGPLALSSSRLSSAGASHGGDPLVEVGPAFQVLQEGAGFVIGVDFHRVAAVLNFVGCVIVPCGE